MKTINTNVIGAEGVRALLHTIDENDLFAVDTLLGEPGKKYPNTAPNTPAEGVVRTLVSNSNEVTALNVGPRLAALEDAVARGPFG
jgi:hypothetical protein